MAYWVGQGVGSEGASGAFDGAGAPLSAGLAVGSLLSLGAVGLGEASGFSLCFGSSPGRWMAPPGLPLSAGLGEPLG